jgi:hypothetical protein
MKKILLSLVTAFAIPSSFAATRSLAPANNTPANQSMLTPAHGTWMMGSKTRGLTVSNSFSGMDGASIGFTNFLNDTDSLRWNVGVSLSNPDPGPATFGFNVDLGYRAYRFVSGNVKGFTEPGFTLGKATNTVKFSDAFYIGFSYRFGAEYFFSPNLSLGGMGGIAASFTDGFDRIVVGTATTAVFLTWYW